MSETVTESAPPPKRSDDSPSPFLILLMGTLFSCGFIWTLVWQAAAFALSGVILCILGHAIMKAADHAEYALYSTASVAQVGAVGGAVLSPALVLFNILIGYSLSPSQDADGESFFERAKSAAASLLQFTMAPAMGAAFGAVGSKILANHGHDVLGVTESAISGAIGGAILGPGLAVVWLLLIGCCAGGMAAAKLL